MRWEHIFAFAQNGVVYRQEQIDGVTAPGRPVFPMAISQYIYQLGVADGYEFAGSYPKEDGLVIVLKRHRTEM